MEAFCEGGPTKSDGAGNRWLGRVFAMTDTVECYVLVLMHS